MQLTRRDAVLSAAAGLVSGTGLAAFHSAQTSPSRNAEDDGTEPIAEDTVATLVSLADVVYPSSVETTPEFVNTYVQHLEQTRIEQIRTATADLNATARAVTGRRFEALSEPQREGVLRELGVGNVTPRQHGTVSSRVRYHLINGLLLALFTAPKGGQLFGIDNPLGYPGGYHGDGETDDQR